MPDSTKKRWFSDGLVRGKVETEKKLLPPPPAEIYMPEGINFSELWKDEEPEESGGLQTIMTFANTFMILIILIMSFFK